jgi:hypothetical protein
MTSPARILFIPVSGPSGMGEVARCVTLARALTAHDPAVEVLFALSAAAPYLADVPFPQTLFPASPTFHPREVAALILAWRPTTVVFDNAGRTAQLRAARAVGARVIFLSSRRRQRRKAFRLHWMRLLDEHWIAYPEFIAGAPSLLERLKLRMLGRPIVRYLDALSPGAEPGLATAVLARHDLHADEFVLVVPGGGTTHAGMVHSPATVARVAADLAAQGLPTLLVGAPDGTAPTGELRACGRLPAPELLELVRAARVVLVNGGDTLLQVLVAGRPCVAVPMAKDQAHRIGCCARAGIALAGATEVSALASQVRLLSSDAGARRALCARLASARLHNALSDVVAVLEGGAGPD